VPDSLTDSASNAPRSARAVQSAPIALAVGAVREQRAVLWAALPFILISYVAGSFTTWPGPVGIAFWTVQGVFAGFVAVCFIVVRERFRADLKALGAREAYPVAWRRARVAYLANDRLASYAVILAILPLVVGCYTGWKTWLGTAIPFRWDETLAQADRVLHFGYDPWRLLHPVLGREFATDTISLLYESGWAATLHGVITWQALRPPSPSRTRFLVAAVLAWPLIGNVAAAVFMSAGPCYYRFVVSGPNPYEGLITYVHGANDLTRTLQNYLWQAHQSGQLRAVGGGISAMPSMHLVMATLSAIPLWTVGKWGRLVAVAVVLTTLVGAVHLGWHYAVDGYGGILAGALVWAVARGFVRSHREPHDGH